MATTVEAKVILALGSNLGDTEANLNQCISLIGEKIGRVTSISDYYKNDPVDFESDYEFINMCIEISTSLPPLELLKVIKSIEVDMGRVKTISSHEDRIIDIDIVLYNELVMDKKDLIIPHPEYKRRDFVLSPMNQIGEYLDPQVFLSCGQLLK